MNDPAKRQHLIAAMHHHMNLIQLTLHQFLEMRRKKKKRSKRTVWVRPWIGRRHRFGLYDQLMQELRSEDEAAFTNFMRMSPAMFDELLDRVAPRITKQHTPFREPLPPAMKLAITLRHIASGSKYASMKFGWRVPHNTQSIIVRDVCKAIQAEYLQELMTCPSTPEGWKDVAQQFEARWNLPHAVGALDGKHVACRCPPKTGSQYFNYKGFYSVVLLALVDADYKFLWADLGGCGSASDAQIYNDSELKQYAEDGRIGFPDPEPLPHDTQDVPYFFVGDDAFGLRTYMMKPYSHRGLTQEERIFNYRLSRARRVVENAFGILANRFQILLTTMLHHPETVKQIVVACLLLHNLMRTRFPTLQNQQLDQPENASADFTPGAWRANFNMVDTVRVTGPNRATRQAKRQRNLLKHWVNSPAGAVSWQLNML